MHANVLLGKGTTKFLNQFTRSSALNGRIVLDGYEVVKVPENISEMTTDLRHAYLCSIG